MDLSSFVLLIIAFVTLFIMQIKNSSDETKFVLDSATKNDLYTIMGSRGFIYPADGTYNFKNIGINFAIGTNSSPLFYCTTAGIMGIGGASYILDYENLRHTDEEPICWNGPGL